MIFVAMAVMLGVAVVYGTVAGIALNESVGGFWIVVLVALLAMIIYINTDDSQYGGVYHLGMAGGWLAGTAIGGLFGTIARARRQSQEDELNWRP